MKVKIGFITSPHMASFLKKIEYELAPYCIMTYIIVNDPHKSLDKFLEHEKQVDCFIFSGRSLYFPVSENRENISIPCYTIDEFEGDIKELLLQQILINRNLDLSRIFIDCAFEINNYLGLKDFLPEKDLPYFSENQYTSLDTFLHKIKEQHMYLHKTNKVDLSITRTSCIAMELEKEKIPYLYLYPVKEYLLNFFMQVIHSTEGKNKKTNSFAAIAVAPPYTRKAGNTEGVISKYIQFLMSFSHNNGYDFMIQRDKGIIIVRTQDKDIRRLTDNFKNSRFKTSLDTAVKHTSSMGIGMGTDLFQARRNAMKALDLSHKKEGGLYCMDDHNQIIGPIGEPMRITIQSYPNADLLSLSRILHVDHINLQKIISFSILNQEKPFAADQLADYLKVTVRSASRLINKIEKNGGAKSYDENLSSGRGRPKKYFKLMLNKK